MNNDPIIIERSYNAPAATVWAAITDRDAMKQWYFDLPEFKPEVGFRFEFTAGAEGREYLHKCEITEVITGKKLAHTWRYDGLQGNSVVTFELFDEGETTKLRLTHEGLETIAVNGADFAATNFVTGWTQIIGTSLKEYLERDNNI